MALNFPFPHESPYGEAVVEVLNISVQTDNGLQVVGVVSLILLITGLFLLAKSLEKYHGRIVLIAIIISIFAPSLIAGSYQRTFATGIYAVSYDRGLSNCGFDMINERTLHGECEFTFDNYSRNDVGFTVEFYENKNDYPMVSLLNNNAPYEVKLKANARKHVKIESNIDVSNTENHIDNGSARNVDIIIKSGEKSRKL